ncbi:bifunctional 4-hydroxy-2-oxoglutarate aldolase/2-dehydro-3-deoxy-phosphogluconate aldolase [Wenzhouxiangella sp. AB-CW3]|uniref:bifunctional 4-hydroxy-2-oxoglutarate aldolase/2-dehydro-3-deoxy-phosphogluconate aldolase n=1 Tax=Wenzhouxiangella sp. AB-CW3 TaxID=2771012 RepID=UPI00168B3E89|nr:bifunctional 4-hydroxy-2-oxoglutarate aldolase/2-dehydro-3-deoxy-phosphogluconate aldolase [Wenzhouxiangella sp. AB-CW3]QOC21769.1 bifunctional 4-hydroxy-2-oxoglutarate aldolase/2-dehydro-3-deoxy-phosphogluconate aldolase [Wenzhouxiangella sp. AB-CW3]
MPDPCTHSARIDAILGGAGIVPVLTIEQLDTAAPLAEALLDGGLTVLEVTLRTPVALEAIGVMSAIAGVTVGAGTILNRADLKLAAQAGAAFAVSPGCTPDLYRMAAGSRLPLLPGVASASEVMLGIEHGFTRFKFFPARAAGGAAMLKAWQGPLAKARFCPTGGIDAGNAADYLALDNVLAIGGSWMVPKQALANRDWLAISEQATSARQMAASVS